METDDKQWRPVKQTSERRKSIVSFMDYRKETYYVMEIRNAFLQDKKNGLVAELPPPRDETTNEFLEGSSDAQPMHVIQTQQHTPICKLL